MIGLGYSNQSRIIKSPRLFGKPWKNFILSVFNKIGRNNNIVGVRFTKLFIQPLNSDPDIFIDINAFVGRHIRKFGVKAKIKTRLALGMRN